MAKYLSVLVVILLAIISGYSLLHPGLYPTHDGEYHVVRFYEFFKTFQDGNLYPRWAPDLNNGYGIPLFNYVYPLPNYISLLLHGLGISFIDTFKISMFIAILIGSPTSPRASRNWRPPPGPAVSAIFYTYSPYHFVDIYIRGSIGEVWALAFFPLMLWGIYKALIEKNKLFSILSGLFFALIIFSHNILALLFFIFVIFYIGFIFFQSKKKYYVFLQSFIIIAIGLSVSTIFWLPALAERHFSVGLQIYSVDRNFPDLYTLLFPSWGSGFSNSNLGNQMSHQIGIANLVAVFLSVLATVIFYIKRSFKTALLTTFFISWFVVVFFLMLKVSLPIWHTIPLMNYFQFPWRLLSIEILLTSFLVGAIFKLWNSKILAFCLILFTVLISIQYTKPAYYHLRDDNYYFSRPNFIHGTNSPGNTFNTFWFNKKLKKQPEKITIGKDLGEIKSSSIKSTQYFFYINTKKNTPIVVNTAYFPGWTVFIDKKQVETKYNKDGLISFFLPKGEHLVEVSFLNTSIRTISIAITLLSLLSLLALFINNRYVKIKR